MTDKEYCDNGNCQRRFSGSADSNDFWVRDYYFSSHPYIENPKRICQLCGGIWNGDAWIHQCKTCGKIVKKGSLVGLFVPHLCKECESRTSEQEIKSGHVCSMCRAPYSRCTC